MGYNSYKEAITDTYKYDKKKNKFVKVKTRSGTNLQAPIIKPIENSSELGNPPPVPVSNNPPVEEVIYKDDIGEWFIFFDIVSIALTFTLLSFQIHWPIWILGIFQIIIAIVIWSNLKEDEYNPSCHPFIPPIYVKLKFKLLALPFKLLWDSFRLIVNVGMKNAMIDLLNGISMFEKERKSAIDKIKEEK